MAESDSNDGNEDDSQPRLTLLDSLKRASEDLQTKPLYLPLDFDSPSVKTLLEIETKPNFVLSQDPDLFTLGRLVTQIKTLIVDLRSSESYSIRSFLYRRLVSYQISYAALSIDREIQGWVDKQIVRDLVQMLQECCVEEDKLRALARFERRVSMGFDREFQELVLREKVFHVLESVLCDTSCPLAVRENAGMAIAALAWFNKNVFVGLVLMGFTVRGLVSMGTIGALRVLMALVKLIKGHLVDEMELDGDVPRIISNLSSEDICLKATAMDCILEMAYFGRKEVIETMFVCGLVEKLVCLQRRSENDDDIIIVEKQEEEENNTSAEEKREGDDDDIADNEERKMEEDQPFSGCIARFAVQVEISEGMDKSEKKEVKLEILRRAREACISEAEAAAIAAEVRVDISGRYPGGKVQAALTETRKSLSELVLEPLREEQYYEVREPFNIMAIVKSPMGLMVGFMVFVMFVMPKMTENMDPEEIRQAQEEMRSQGVPSLSNLLTGGGRRS